MVKPLTDELLVLLQESHIDFTSFFRIWVKRPAAMLNRRVDFLSTSPASISLVVALARPESGPRVDGPGQSGLHPPQPSVKEALTAATAGDLLNLLEQLMAALSARMTN